MYLLGKKGGKSKIHNHAAHGCLMKILDGKIEENLYNSQLDLMDSKYMVRMIYLILTILLVIMLSEIFARLILIHYIYILLHYIKQNIFNHI